MRNLYAILDLPTIAQVAGHEAVADFVTLAAQALFASNISTLQLRAKDCSPQEVLRFAEAIKSGRDVAGSACKLILNDRPDLVELAGFDGCHLGQQDLSLEGARRILARPKILGLSTHSAAQIEAANTTDADYVAIGPIFATSSKLNPDPVVGLDGFARLRKLTSKPVVAIGGITHVNFRAVLDAGADSVAVIGDLYRSCTTANFAERVAENLADFLE